MKLPHLPPTALLLLAAMHVAAPASASAQSTPLGSRTSDPESTMRYDLVLDLSITAGAALIWASTELLEPSLVSSCRWCDRNADGSDSLNGFDADARGALRWNDTGAADTLSNVFSFVLAPLAGIGIGALVTAHDDRLDELPADMLVVAESAMLALVVNGVSKVSFARERPDIHARNGDDGNARRSSSDNVSFFSGHTTLAFALAVSAGTIASMRHHRLAPLMWATGLALASTAGYLRIAADRHYATDVLTGAVVGSLIGFSVPYFMHRPRTAGPTITAMPARGGVGIVLSGTM